MSQSAIIGVLGTWWMTRKGKLGYALGAGEERMLCDLRSRDV